MTMTATAIRICALLVALSACAPSVGASQSGASAAGEGSTSQGSSQDGRAGEDSGANVTSSDVSTDVETDDDSGTTQVGGDAGDTPRVKGPRPADLPQDLPVPVASELSPVCAERGDTIDLEVTTEPGGAIGYQAVYSDNGSGAAVPLGEGYGGNDRGYADDDGIFTSSWVVGLDAPSGPARLDVVVGHKGKFGYDDPHFAVADENGNCSEAWLAQDSDD